MSRAPQPSILLCLALFFAQPTVCPAAAQEFTAERGRLRWAPHRPPAAGTSASENATGQVRQTAAEIPLPIEPLPQPRRRSEESLNLNYLDTALPDALKLFVEESGLNVVASAKASKLRVSLQVMNVSPEQGLAALARSNGMWYRRDRNSGVYWLFTDEERATDVLDPERLRMLESEINEAFPDSYVKLSLVGSQVVVRGQARDAVEASQILKIVSLNVPPVAAERRAEEPTVNLTQTSLLPNGASLGMGVQGLLSDVLDGDRRQMGSNIVNLLLIPGEQQVALRVTVAEVNRSAARSIGLNFNATDDQGNVVFRSLVGGIMQLDDQGNLIRPLANFTTMLDNGQIELAINALRQLKLARTLAEPTLTALNGKEARFRAGGQFAVPVVTGATNTGLQGVAYIPFGVQLVFTPNIVERDRVRLDVNADVSTRSLDLATNLGGDPEEGGTQVPGLETRTFQTTVELKDGQTLAVAGLIKNDYGAQADRFPFFGDLPVVGRLGAFDRTSAGEQELVILITPQLVRPIDPCAAPPLPGSDVYEPDDIEFYLGAHLESQRAKNYRSPVRTDLHRQMRYRHCADAYIIGPSGYSCGTPETGMLVPGQ